MKENEMTDKRPFISIVAPVYGVEKYLNKTIDCVLGQSFDDFELILVDDKSPDGCPEICDKAAEKSDKIKVVHHAENMGLSAARNTGMEAASGRFIWFFDPDDHIDGTFFEKIKEASENTPAKVFLFGLTEEYADENGEIKNTQTIVPEDKYLIGKEEVRSEVLYLEKNTLYGYAWNKVYDLDYLKKTGIVFEKITLIEDIVFNMKVFDGLDSLRLLPISPYHYNRRYDGSLSVSYIPNYFELNGTRIRLLFEQFSKWGMCDDETRGEIAVLYTRYIYSAIARTYDKRSGMTSDNRKKWLNSVFAENLFNETIPYGKPESRSLKIMISALQKKQTKKSLALGRFIYSVKNSLPMLFSKIKHKK